MAKLADIVTFLDGLLNTAGVPEAYASNGLQIEANTEVRTIGFAVDACRQSLEQLSDCDLMIVHHGLFWPKIARLTGPLAKLVGTHYEKGVSLYASHLPLDVHPELGNNAQILQRLGFERGDLFAPVGYLADCNLERGSLDQAVQSVIGTARLLPFGAEHISRVAVSSGQASVAMVDQAVAAGAQALITGEAGHPIYHAAEQAGLNIWMAGHYQTEVWGVRALMPILEQKFGVNTRFVDIPTGF